MISGRFLLQATIAGVGAMAVLPAYAFHMRPFDAKTFEAAQAARKSILSGLATKTKSKDLVAFEIDFDSQKDLLRKFDMFIQSTLISFKGSKEVSRCPNGAIQRSRRGV